MPDRGKVIKGLECCLKKNGLTDCNACPYGSTHNDTTCIDNVQEDALALLKDAKREPEDMISIRTAAGFLACYAVPPGHTPLGSGYDWEVGWEKFLRSLRDEKQAEAPDTSRLIQAWEIFRESNPYGICRGKPFRAIREPEYCMGQMVDDTIEALKRMEEKRDGVG